MTISGKTGLYKVVSETRNGLVAESLTDGRKVPVFVTDRSSILEDINIFTTEGEIPLKEVLWKIFEHEGGEPVIDAKTNPEAAKTKFAEILPEYDKERVYFSDIKKVFAWYNQLLEKDMISKPEPEDKEEEGKKTSEDEAENIEKKPDTEQDTSGSDET